MAHRGLYLRCDVFERGAIQRRARKLRSIGTKDAKHIVNAVPHGCHALQSFWVPPEDLPSEAAGLFIAGSGWCRELDKAVLSVQGGLKGPPILPRLFIEWHMCTAMYGHCHRRVPSVSARAVYDTFSLAAKLGRSAGLGSFAFLDARRRTYSPPQRRASCHPFRGPALLPLDIS